MHREQYINKLQAKGFELIGKGLYANVLAKPGSDKCIKVASNDPWPGYIRWATNEGYAGKYAPKVTSLKFHKGNGYDEFYVAIMERLVCTIGNIKSDGGYADCGNNPCVELHNAIYDYSPRREELEAKDFFAFVDHMQGSHFSGDLHEGNVMLRKDGQIVVTDPCSGGGSDKFRIKSGACV